LVPNCDRPYSTELTPPDVTLGIERLEDDAGFTITATDGALPDAEPQELFQMHPEPSDARRISMRIIMNIIEAHDWTFEVTASADRTRFEFRDVT